MKILFQGDSITDGNRYKEKSQEWDKNHQIGHSYVYPIVSLLGSRYPERDYTFINRGVSGDRTDTLLARWEEDTLQHQPDVLCLLCGTNDSFSALPQEKGSVDVSGVLQRYEKLLCMTKESCPNIKLVIFEPFHGYPVEKQQEQSVQCGIARLQGIQSGVRALADKYGAIFIELQRVFDDAFQIREHSYWIWDGIHPTEAGHGLIVKAFFEATKELFDCDGKY